MLLDTLMDTTLARDLLTPTLMLKLSHGWLILTTDMLDIHMPMVSMVPVFMVPVSMEPVSMVLPTDTTVMLLEDTTLARDLLTPTPMLKPGTALMVTEPDFIVDMVDTEPEFTVHMLHTPTDMLVHTDTPDTLTESKVVKKY